MIPIKKGVAPSELIDLKNKADAMHLSPKRAYDTLKNPLKKKVIKQLVEEQGHLCAYCMCLIPRGDVDPGISPITIEHYVPKSPEDGRDVGQGLDYNNFLAVCNGNTAKQGKREYIDLTCDKYRGNKEFRKINPCIPDTLKSIYYKMDGTISATDPDVKYDIEEVLNLNCANSSLIAERKEVLSNLIYDMESIEDTTMLLQYCKDRLEVFLNETDKKTAYVGIIIWYLKSMIQALESA